MVQSWEALPRSCWGGNNFFLGQVRFRVSQGGAGVYSCKGFQNFTNVNKPDCHSIILVFDIG